MSDAEIILKLIEEVSPDDTVKLGEIDMEAFRYITGYSEGFECGAQRGRWYACEDNPDPVIGFDWRPIPQYTRSRDALKSIRPTGFTWAADFSVDPRGFPEYGGSFSFMKGGERFFGKGTTEELAELHAIIQAIEHDRTHLDR